MAFTHLRRDELIAHLNALIDDEQQPMFRGFKFQEYTESFFGGTLTKEINSGALQVITRMVHNDFGSRELLIWIKIKFAATT